MQYLPLFVSLHHRVCLVVGGGEVAARKIELLLRAGAQVYVIAPELCPVLNSQRQENRITHISGSFENHDAAQLPARITLIIAATNQDTVNRKVFEYARALNVPVNVVDTPALCDFTFGAIVDRDPVLVAISSGGSAPVLARSIRSIIEAHLPAGFGQFIKLINKFRDKIQALYKTEDEQQTFYRDLLQGPAAESGMSGQLMLAEQVIKDRMQYTEANEIPNRAGEVYLIGAGPGAADLLTFRALRLLRKADVILYDRLVSSEILEMAKPDAERFYVGKQPDNHCVPQNKINEMLLSFARQGKNIARLKGGDPFVFGRGAEEAQALAQQGISFQVVPGITSAAGCGAYAGIPLTHRDYAQACRFVTGHTKDGQLSLDWAGLATEAETLVFYMGLKNLGTICSKLIEHGLPDDFPVAIIEQGTTARQRVFIESLTSAPDKALNEKLQSPCLIIIGKVVQLHKQLSWHDPAASAGICAIMEAGLTDVAVF